MPVLDDGAQRCALRNGTYTVGGIGPDALPISSLECCPAVATLVVSPDEPPTIQRITASVVVRVDRVPLGIAAKALHQGAQIEFGDTCLTYTTDDDGETMIDTTAVEATPSDVTSELAAPARIVDLRTGDAISLGTSRVVVGRDETCDFIIRGTRVSRRHFSVAPVQAGFLLRDESANGTIVNGTRVNGTLLLAHGDVLRIDEHDLRFELAGVATPVRSTEAVPTEVLDLSSLRREFATGAGGEPQPAMHSATLEIVRGRYTGASFSIERAVCAIGRDPQSDVRILDESVSANHATLLRKGASWFVVDLRSANGTFVNGSRVAGERALLSGSRLKLGSVELVFRALGDGAERANAEPHQRSWRARLLRAIRNQ